MPKPIKRRADERKIAAQGEWELVELKTLSAGDWMTLKLYRNVPAKRGAGKRTFQFGWSRKENRWALCQPLDALARTHPHRLEWLKQVMGERHV